MKKSKQTELDVDYIGGEGPLTKEDEQAISEYLKTLKQTRKKLPAKKLILKPGIQAHK